MTTVDARAVMRAVRDRDPSERIRLLQTIKPRLPEQYVPHVPHPTQQLFLLQNGREVLFGGSAGGGKALWVHIYIPTPTGWTTMGAIRAGDEVLGTDGRPCRVLAVSGVMYDHDCYEVTFSDGSTLIADAGHMWTVVDDAGEQSTITTREVRNHVKELSVPSVTARGVVYPPRRITSVTPRVSVPVQCITVDSHDHLFLAGRSMIPTHNSDALLMSALAYVDVPGYNALILRRTWPDLSLPGAIMDRAREWLQGTDAEPRDGGRVWRFPSGARLSFGYLQHDKNKFNYQSAEFHYVAFDELTQFQESTYTYMFSRVRKPVVACARCRRPVAKYFADGIATVQWKHTESKTTRCDDPTPNPQSLREYGPAPDGTTLFDVPLRVRSACVDEGDVLTETGWKPIQTVIPGERVYSLDAHGAMELKPVEWVYAGPATHGLVTVRKKNLYMSMTPDHRVVWKQSPNGVLHIDPWDMIQNRCVDIIRTSRSYQASGRITNPFGWDTDDYLAFLGLFIAEGSTSYRPTKYRSKTIITQCTTENQGVIKDLLNRLDLPVKGSIRVMSNGRVAARWYEDGFRHTRRFDTERQARDFLDTIRAPLRWCLQANGDFCIGRKEVYDHFAPLGRAHEKHIPREILENATPEQLGHLLWWMLFGDGTSRGTSHQYFTCSPQLADDVQEIGIKLGFKVQARSVDDGHPNHHVRHVVYLNGDSDSTRVDRSEVRNDTEHAAYAGDVYCIKVQDNENFVLRQRGYVWVSGNSNPGNIGSAWVRDRFINPATRVRGAVFIPSLLSDNPSLDQETYRHNLEHLNPVDRERLLNGDWDITEQGDYFQRHWFTFLDDIPRDTRIRWVRYWDLAATEKGDWTAGCLLGLTTEGQWIVADVRRMRGTPYEVERFIAATAATDGTGVAIRMEQEPGSSGVNTIDHYRRRVLVGYDFKPDKKTASKTVRANPVSSAAEAGNIILITGAWNREFLDEITVYPRGSHDDMTDSLTGAFSMLARTKGRLLV